MLKKYIRQRRRPGEEEGKGGVSVVGAAKRELFQIDLMMMMRRWRRGSSRLREGKRRFAVSWLGGRGRGRTVKWTKGSLITAYKLASSYYSLDELGGGGVRELTCVADAAQRVAL